MALHTTSRTFVIPSGGTSGSIKLEKWDTLGLLVPTIDSAILTLAVSQDGITFFNLKDGLGTPMLVFAAGPGNFAIDTVAMAMVAGYQYLRVTASASQSADRTFTLCWDDPR